MSETERPRISVINDNAAFLELMAAIHVLAKPFSIDQVTGLAERLIGRGQPVAS